MVVVEPLVVVGPTVLVEPIVLVEPTFVVEPTVLVEPTFVVVLWCVVSILSPVLIISHKDGRVSSFFGVSEETSKKTGCRLFPALSLIGENLTVRRTVLPERRISSGKGDDFGEFGMSYLS